jgi:hypothetical protein
MQPIHLQAQERHAPPGGDRERVVQGIVVAVNSELSAITIRQPNLLGRLRISFKSYEVKQPTSLNGLRSGDRITAVISNSDGMLHRLRRIRDCQVFEAQRN